MENFRWKSIIIFLACVYLFVNLPVIIDTLSTILTNATDAINDILKGIVEPRRSYRRSDTYAIARLCVFGIIVVAAIKLLRKR
jgi:hypothetical protein